MTGTPGPLDGYCTSGGANPETGTVAKQAAGASDPMSPYYFPDVVRSPDGSLTGYFDYRPLAKPVIGITATADRAGYWLGAADGGVFTYGDAQFYGSMGGTALNKPVVGIAGNG